MDSNKDENETSRFIDLGLPKDRKPMLLSDYKNGQRWGWIKEVDYDTDIKSEYVAEKPETLPRNSALWIEEFIKYGENKHFMKTPIVGNRTVAIGTNNEIYANGDFGLFGAVLEAYNHHWNLKISPDDFWIPVAVRIGSKINDVAKSDKVRNFFVDFEGKKDIKIDTKSNTIYDVDYVWLFDQFSEKIRETIKKKKYAELMTSNFSTSTPVSKIASQINVMSSLQEYFNFSMTSMCGIKGIEMLGKLEDWQHLIEKIDELKKLLFPLEEELNISGWLRHVRKVYVKLVETFRGNPDKDWWSRIVSKVAWESGKKDYEGWIIQFLEGNYFFILFSIFFINEQ